jgi:hypothetical protein
MARLLRFEARHSSRLLSSLLNSNGDPGDDEAVFNAKATRWILARTGNDVNDPKRTCGVEVFRSAI